MVGVVFFKYIKDIYLNFSRVFVSNQRLITYNYTLAIKLPHNLYLEN